jgi:NAD(P)-dependent dehydrogenase (short-subunit alcohol dehydrogenase family)
MSSPPDAGDPVGGAESSDLFSIAGKIALVTGASVGIGRMIAEGFAQAGAKVYLVARNEAKCREVAAGIGGAERCVVLAADLATEDGCRGLAEAYAEREGRLDILVNNAATIRVTPLAEHSDDVWDRALALNVKAAAHLTRFLLPVLESAAEVNPPARVINVGSIDATRVPHMDSYAYTASKAAIQHLTRHLAWRLAPRISVNCIAPGTFPSRMSASYLEGHEDDIAAGIPMRRIGTPADVAGAARFLASRAGSYVTGAILPVDGGLEALR